MYHLHAETGSFNLPQYANGVCLNLGWATRSWAADVECPLCQGKGGAMEWHKRGSSWHICRACRGEGHGRIVRVVSIFAEKPSEIPAKQQLLAGLGLKGSVSLVKTEHGSSVGAQVVCGLRGEKLPGLPGPHYGVAYLFGQHLMTVHLCTTGAPPKCRRDVVIERHDMQEDYSVTTTDIYRGNLAELPAKLKYLQPAIEGCFDRMRCSNRHCCRIHYGWRLSR